MVTETWEPWGSGGIFNDFDPARPSDRFGHSVALSETSAGSYRLAVGVPWKSVDDQRNAGMIVVYELDSSIDRWSLLGRPLVHKDPTPTTEAGHAVDLVDDFLLVGIPGANGRTGQAQLYRYNYTESVWDIHPVALTGASSGDDFGVSLTLVRELEVSTVDKESFLLVVGALTHNRGGAGYVQTFLEA